MTVKQILQKVGQKVADFDISRCIPKDHSGTELQLESSLRDLQGNEINFKQLKLAPVPLTKKFTVHFPDEQKNSIVWRPNAVLREVLAKMCEHRGIQLRAYVAKSLDGAVLDLNSTLDTLGVEEITFTTKAEPADVKILLQDGVSHTLRFNPEMLLGEALQRVCEHRGLAAWKFVAKNVDGKILDPSLPFSRLDIPKRTVDFSTLRQSRWSKELAMAQNLARKAGQELRDAHPRPSQARASSSQIQASINAIMEKAVGAISADFRGHDVMQYSELTRSVELRPERPTWLIHVAGLENLLSGLPSVAICIAFITDGQTRAAAVYSIWTEELFFAEEGGGAFCGETQQLFVSNVTSVEEAIVCTHPVASEYFLRILTFCPRLRCLGTPELELCYLARGSVDCVVNFNSSLWSSAAASLIAKEAYCTVVDVDGDGSHANSVTQTSFIDIERSVNVVAGNSHLVSRIVAVLREYGRQGDGAGSGLDDSERLPQSFDMTPSL
eukprot:TRINITY_DN4146_c0_g2_i2.p1 TRINITY_DN4146_c0_g2~~TRINITY_DN4146_c0_g2_i2.p1  ORF type:complete len:536 (-),score=70.80 TRINITY_DN4146_c0_g2_i2:1012-2502(-)